MIYYNAIIMLNSNKLTYKQSVYFINYILNNIPNIFVKRIDYLGLRALAYSIKKEFYAHYFSILFLRDVSVLYKLKSFLLNSRSEVIRFLILLTKNIPIDKIA